MAQHEPTYRGHQDHVKANGIERQDVIYVETEEGKLILLICPECRLIETHCLHERNSWSEDETQLTCDLCGIDGT